MIPLSHPHTLTVSQILSPRDDVGGTLSVSLSLEKKWSEAIDVRFTRLEGFLQFYKDYFDSWIEILKSITKSLSDMSKLVLFDVKKAKSLSNKQNTQSPSSPSGPTLTFTELVKRTQEFTLEDAKKHQKFREVVENSFVKEVNKLLIQLQKLRQTCRDKVYQAESVRSKDLQLLRVNLKKFYKNSIANKSSSHEEDPWLVEQQMFVSLQSFVGSENSYRSSICNATVSILTFEKMMMESLKGILCNYANQHRNLYSELSESLSKFEGGNRNTLDNFEDTQATFQALGLSLDPHEVLGTGLKPSLIDASLLLEGILTAKPEEMIQLLALKSKTELPNIAGGTGGRLHRIVKYGILNSRNGFIFKSSLRPSFAILTEPGFLHVYSISSRESIDRAYEILANSNRLANPAITISLRQVEIYVLDASIGLFEFSVPSNSAIFGKGEKKIQLRADSEAEMKDWMTEIAIFISKPDDDQRGNKDIVVVTDKETGQNNNEDDEGDRKTMASTRGMYAASIRTVPESDSTSQQQVNNGNNNNVEASIEALSVSVHEDFADFPDADDGFADFNSSPPAAVETERRTSPDPHNPWK